MKDKHILLYFSNNLSFWGFQLNLIYFTADRLCKDSTDATVFLNKDFFLNQVSQLSDLMLNFLTHPFSLCKSAFFS